MTKNLQLAAEKRTILGRKVKQIRREGSLPANIFGKKIKSQAVSLSLKDFQQVFDQVGETNLIDLMVKGEKKARPSLISNVQIHPVTDLPLHADFHQVDLTQKVTAKVPVEVTGFSPAVKDKGAVLITLFDEIEVEALPANLPDKFTVNISGLKEFNDSVLAKDLKVDPKKVEVKLGKNEAIVMVQEPKEEEEEAPPPVEAAEGEEAEAPAEGEEAAPEEGKETAKGKEAEKPETKETKEKSGQQAEESKSPGKTETPSEKKAKKK